MDKMQESELSSYMVAPVFCYIWLSRLVLILLFLLKLCFEFSFQVLKFSLSFVVFFKRERDQC